MIPPSSSQESPSEATPLIRETKSSTTTRTDIDPETGQQGGSYQNTNGNAANGDSGAGNNGIDKSPLLENDFDHFVDITEKDELDKPWPATFERSISLLAGPIRDTQFIEEITKSPKIITPNIRDRRRLNELLATPETTLGPLRPQQQSDFRQGIVKIQSLDFGTSIDDREREAHLYRMKLLEAQKQKQQQQQQQQKQQPQPMSKIGEGLRKQKEKQALAVEGGGGESDYALSDYGGEKASFGQCAFNMANILMGVGMLGLPYIFKRAGWIGGFFVTLSFSSVAYRTSILLGRELNGDARPTSIFVDNPKGGTGTIVRFRKPLTSFPDIARSAFGQAGTVLLSIVLYFELFSCLCIFFVTLGDHLHTLFPWISVTRHMIYVSFCLAVPTALLRTPKLLSYLSAVGTVATACVVSVVAGSALYNGDISEIVAEKKGIDVETSPTHQIWNSSGLPVAFGLIAYTFSGHAIIPSIFSSMKRPQEYEKMIGFTFLVVTLCCLIVAASGYWMFGSMVDDQITLSLERNSGDDNILMKILTWLMILTAFSKFTLTAFPLALGFEEIVAPIIPNDHVMEFASSVIKLLLISLSLLVAIYVPSFSVLCSLVGLICTMLVSVIFPAAAHLKMFGSQLPLWEQFLDWIFIVAGTFMAVVGTIKAT